MKKIALTGGGTAGHIMPNIALVPELKKRKFDIIYIGSKTGMDKEMVENNNLPFFGISTDKLRRYVDFKNFFMPFNVVKGISEAKKILKQEKVDIVFSKGGFVALPVVLAASSLKIPIISHEADYTPGLANKISLPLSKKICCNFKETAKMFGEKGVHTGCPIRDELKNGDKERAYKILKFKDTKKPIIFITGGSLGSVYINKLIRKNLDKILPTANVVHACGKGKVDHSLKLNGYKQFEIITDELPDILSVSNIVISRAGANIIFELLALKKLNLLIPLSKRASRGDQILNAQYFEKNNYSVVLYEEEQNKNENLFFEKLIQIENRKKELKHNLAKSGVDDAVHKICDIIQKELK